MFNPNLVQNDFCPIRKEYYAHIELVQQTTNIKAYALSDEHAIIEYGVIERRSSPKP